MTYPPLLFIAVAYLGASGAIFFGLGVGCRDNTKIVVGLVIMITSALIFFGLIIGTA